MLTDSFRIHDTYGYPLTLQLDYARERGLSISIPHFYRDAIKAGWKQKKILTTIEEALIDLGKTREYIKTALDYLRNDNG